MDPNGMRITIFLFAVVPICFARHGELSTEFGTHVICDGWNDCSHKHLVGESIQYRVSDTFYALSVDCPCEIARCVYCSKIAGTECHIDCDSASSCKSSELTFSGHCDYSNLNCTNYHCMSLYSRCFISD